jgi:hypothetical protein
VKTEEAAAFSLWVKIGQPRTLEAFRNEATVAELTTKVPASREPDLRLGKAVARGRGCGFSGGTSKEASREAEITVLYTKSRIFLPEVRAINRAGRTAMIARGRADLSCGGYVLLGLARRGVCRRLATPDAEELALMRWLNKRIRRRRL